MAKSIIYSPATLEKPPLIQTPISVLLLGLDGRKGDKNPRCDAIHIFTLDPKSGMLQITSIPRGTFTNLDGSIISNACHRFGVDATIGEIEKIAEVKIDYVVKTGFSQTLGILRTVGLPTISTLQFLRNRRVPLGDNQRSRNQALFFKDQILTRFEHIANLPKPIKYVLFKTLDSNLDFELAQALIETIRHFKIYTHPEKIQLVMKPKYLPALKEIHLTSQTTDWKRDDEYSQYQNNLEAYIENLISRATALEQTNPDASYTLIKTPFIQHIWLQIDDYVKRQNYHYSFVKLYAHTSYDSIDIRSVILDFITQMEDEGNANLKEKGEELLGELS